MRFNSGIDIRPLTNPFGFGYGKEVFGPQVEVRRLDSIQGSLLEPDCSGPEEVYAIAMDVGKIKHKQKLKELHLLYGVVTYAQGRLGKEPVRSQGHIHKTSVYANGWSTPEVYEIWSGRGVIYMQETAKDNPGRCFAVEAGPGEVIIVPPGWAHATISADPDAPLTFGAWCDRDYGFDYHDVRAHHGLAYFPLLAPANRIEWHPNKAFQQQPLVVKKPRVYTEFNIDPAKPIYTQFEEDAERFLFVPRPDLAAEKWKNFIP